MEHDDALDAIRQAWADEARFFSTAGQPEQERWVVREFLTRLGVRFAEPELVSEEPHSKVDVAFRDVRFQVKEIPDPGTRRGDEVNALWRQAMSANRVEDIVGLDIAYDIPPPMRAFDLIFDKAQALVQSGKYKGPARLDLLVYVTRTRTSPVLVEEVDGVALAALGWRSISYLMGRSARVLHAGGDAPSLLRVARDGG